MLVWILMIMLSIFLGSCAVVILTSCYQLLKKFFRSPDQRYFPVNQQHLKTSQG